MNVLRTRRAAVAAAIVALFAASLALAPVRAAAAQLLAIFRVNEIRTVAFDPDEVPSFERLGFDPDEIVTFERGGSPEAAAKGVAVDGVAEAGAAVSFPVRVLAGLGQPAEVTVHPAQHIRAHVDGARLSALLEAVGLDPAAVPAEPATIDVQTGDGVVIAYDEGPGYATLFETPSPVVVLPEGWDPTLLGQMYLTVLGMDPRAAQAMAGTIDWTSTLVVPVPAGEAEAVDVRVDGVNGVLFETGGRGSPERRPVTGLDRETRPATDGGPRIGPVRASSMARVVVWQKGGILYALESTRTADGLVALANELR